MTQALDTYVPHMPDPNQLICGTCTECGQKSFYARDADITDGVEICDCCDGVGTWIDSDDYFSPTRPQSYDQAYAQAFDDPTGQDLDNFLGEQQ